MEVLKSVAGWWLRDLAFLGFYLGWTKGKRVFWKGVLNYLGQICTQYIEVLLVLSLD